MAKRFLTAEAPSRRQTASVRIVNGIVEAGKRDEEADGKHRSRHGIGDGRDDACHLDQLRTRLPPRIGKDDSEANGENRRHAASVRLFNATCQNSGSSPAATCAVASCMSTRAGSRKPKRIGRAQTNEARTPRAPLSVSSGRRDICRSCGSASWRVGPARRAAAPRRRSA
jgi:hypothetical protein